ncbi:MAG: NAD-binding protein [Pseudomonadota bacterium]
MIGKIPNRVLAALSLIVLGAFTMSLGVGFTERDLGNDSGPLEYLYYALSLFVIGGVDLGTPQGGPVWARAILWLIYFAAPILTVSAILDAIFQIFSAEKLKLRSARKHLVIIGEDPLVEVVLERLRVFDSKALAVLVVSRDVSPYRLAQLRKHYRVLVRISDIVDDYVFEKIRVKCASRVLILGSDSLAGFGMAHSILRRHPELDGKITLHCPKLRVMRAMSATETMCSINSFNMYQLAARYLVETEIEPVLDAGPAKTVIVLAGFGRFGQSILERLQELALDRIESVAVLADDAERRLLVTKEQVSLSADLKIYSLQGDISHPQVWSDLNVVAPIESTKALYIMATNRGEDNLRTALWLRKQNEKAVVVARTDDALSFAQEVGVHDRIAVVSVEELAGSALPKEWLLRS